MANDLGGFKSVLVCGLGNRSITADALGPAVADALVITRHVRLCEASLFDSLFSLEVASFAPGVLAQTGIDTGELIRGAVEHVAPDLVVAIDALAARSADRLMTTVQLCDTGIAPGSGMGNHRCRLDRQTLGVPVIAIGVPTVVNSATLIRDALEVGGIGDISPDLERLLEGGRSFFVSPKESDLAVRELSAIIARALNSAFGSEVLE
jgi:spore protease